jgi:hypothetical protein
VVGKAFVYEKGKYPAMSLEVKNVIHAFYAFYAKWRNGEIVVTTTVELVSEKRFWSSQKSMSYIQAFTLKHDMSVRMIHASMLQEVPVGFIAETTSSLNHNRGDLSNGIRRICKIPSHAPPPLTCNDKMYRYW